VADFRLRLGEQLAQPGFALVAGWCGPELAGYVFGFTLTESCEVWHTILAGGGLFPQPGRAGTCAGATGVAYVSELLVRRVHRRRGVATALLAGFLAGRAEACAALLAHPDAAAAQATYARLGWRRIGWGTPFPGSARYDTLVLDL
jgi:GNAT superfamily N-acetyltransferase